MSAEYDLIIRNGTIYDGSGRPPMTGDVAVSGEIITAVGQLRSSRGGSEFDARGLAVAPGFINMLSWANRSLLEDGRSQSDIRQGVTLEVLGEGSGRFLAPPGDDAILAGRILAVAGDAALRARAGEANRARAAAQFDPRRLCRTMAGLILETLERRP